MVGAVGVIAAQAQSLLLGGHGVLQVSHLLGEGVIGGQLEGTDGDLLVGPLVGGMTVDVVSGIITVVLQTQILEVLFAELQGQLVVGRADDPAVDVGVDVTVVAGDIHSLAALNGQDLAGGADNGVGAAVVHHGGLQGVQSQLAGLITGHGLRAVEADAVEQAGDIADPGHVHGPAGVHEALDVALIADGAEQHLREGVTGQGVGGLEGAVAIAADVTGRLAVADDARKRVASGNVGIGARVVRQSRGSLGADHQGDDDLGGRAAGQLRLGTEAAVLVTGDDTDTVQNGNCFLVLDLVLVGEIPVLGGSRADGDQRHGHNQCENQGQEFLH